MNLYCKVLGCVVFVVRYYVVSFYAFPLFPYEVRLCAERFYVVRLFAECSLCSKVIFCFML